MNQRSTKYLHALRLHISKGGVIIILRYSPLYGESAKLTAHALSLPPISYTDNVNTNNNTATIIIIIILTNPTSTNKESVWNIMICGSGLGDCDSLVLSQRGQGQGSMKETMM